MVPRVLRFCASQLLTRVLVIMFVINVAAANSKMINDELFPLISDDVIFTPDQVAAISNMDRTPENRTGSGLLHPRRRRSLFTADQIWKLPIFYKVDLSYYPEDRIRIKEALEHIMNYTCIPFFEVNPLATMSIPHIMFFNYNVGCLSYIGQLPLDEGQPQLLSLPYYCLKLGKAVHEILHTLGVWHEHQRPDRDQYIRIHDDVISSRYATNFLKTPRDSGTSSGLPYDYNSIMHYGRKQGSINGSITITPINNNYNGNIGQRLELSYIDAKLLNTVYCKDTCTKLLSCQNGGYTDPKNCNVCRCPSGLAGIFCTEVATSIGAKCGRQFFADVGDAITLTSPGYPERFQYQEFVQCNWLIQTNNIVSFNVRFSAIFNVPNPPDSDTCSNWLEVTPLSDLAIPGYRFCDTHRPPENLTLHSRSVLFVLRSRTEGERSQSTRRSLIRGFGITVTIETRKDKQTLNTNSLNWYHPTKEMTHHWFRTTTIKDNIYLTSGLSTPLYSKGICLFIIYSIIFNIAIYGLIVSVDG